MSVEYRRHAVLQFLQDQADLFQTQGVVVESWRWRGERRQGPYYRLAFRAEGRQRSFYLGADEELVGEVRRQLLALQSDRRLQREASRRRQVLRRTLARLKNEWDQELQAVGLYLKGFEVRGWRRQRSQD